MFTTATPEPSGPFVAVAAARDLPVVAPGANAREETVTLGTSSCPAGDQDVAAERLLSLADDLACRRAARATLRERLQARFSVAGHVDRLEDVYPSRKGVVP